MTNPLEDLTDKQLTERVAVSLTAAEAFMSSRRGMTLGQYLNPGQPLPKKHHLRREQLLRYLQEQLRRAKLFYTCGTRDCPNLGTKYIWNSDGSQDPGFVKGKPCWFCDYHAPLFLEPNQHNNYEPLMLRVADAEAGVVAYWSDALEANLGAP